MHHRPHHLEPAKETARLAIFYKVWEPPSHWKSAIGLGISAENARKVLSQEGFWVETYAVQQVEDLKLQIAKLQCEAKEEHHPPLSHVMIFAPWVPTEELMALCYQYPHIHFSVVAHSNVAFLQADHNGMKLLKEAMRLQDTAPNFALGGNTSRFTKWVRNSFGVECMLLPNLYDLSGMDRIPERRA